MKITKTKLQQVIQEELQKILEFDSPVEKEEEAAAPAVKGDVARVAKKTAAAGGLTRAHAAINTPQEFLEQLTGHIKSIRGKLSSRQVILLARKAAEAAVQEAPTD